MTDSLDFINKQEAQLSQTDWASAAHKIRREHLSDLEIYVKGQSMSLETEPLDRSYTHKWNIYYMNALKNYLSTSVENSAMPTSFCLP